MKKAHDSGAFWFVIPLLAVMTTFMLYPALTTFYYGFTSWNGFSSPEWQGFANFRRLFADESFHAALKNTLILACYVPLWVVGPLVIAAVIREGISGSGFFRVASLIPFVVSPVILGILFKVILNDGGPVVLLIRQLTGNPEARSWLAESSLTIHISALVTLFKFFGFGVILFFGAMSKISASLFDAAKVDGCSWFRTQLAVTVPGIRHTIEFFTVLGLITFFARMFPLIFTLTGGGPGYSSFVPEFGIYFQAFQNNRLGYSATWAIFVYLLTFAVLVGQIAMMRGENE